MYGGCSGFVVSKDYGRDGAVLVRHHSWSMGARPEQAKAKLDSYAKTLTGAGWAVEAGEWELVVTAGKEGSPMLPRPDFAEDIAARARWARDHNSGQCKAAWSTGEKFAVALVLDKITEIARMGYSRADAVERLTGDICGSAADAEAWIEEVRAAL